MSEDNLLRWLDETFAKLNPFHSWLLWKELIKTFQASEENDTGDASSGKNGKDKQVEFDIFEANDANMFGETLYATYKCYTYLMKRIDEIDDDNEAENIRNIIRMEFQALEGFLN